MNQKAIQWLYEELPKLVSQGVLTPEMDQRLRAHYGPLDAARPARLAILIFGILGSLLIGSGIILMLAHNWENLSRPVRAGLSFLPLVIAQLMAFWVLAFRSKSQAWCEGVSTGVFLLIGASISLIAQTYNISGDLPRFILTWSLLGLPLVYLFRTVVPALLYLWGISHWACFIRYEDGFAAGYWLLAALILPYFAQRVSVGRYQVQTTLLLWAGCVSVTIAAGVTVERVLPGLWMILYAGLFALMFMAGEFWFSGAEGFWGRPLRHFGAAGILILSFMLTYEWPWHEIGWNHWHWERIQEASWRVIPDAVLGIVVPLAALLLLVTTVRRKVPLGLILGLSPIVATFGYSLSSATGTYGLAAGLFDLYLLVIGLWLMITGMAVNKQGQMNVGLLAVTALLVARFFDGDLSFLLRGLLFIALGIAFLAANLVMLRRKGVKS